MSKTLLADLIDLQRWRKIQDLFADVIGVTIYTVDAQGNLIIKPSNVTRLCDELRISSLYGLKTCIDCIQDNVKSFLEVQKVDIPCQCGLYNFVIPITIDEKEVIGFLIAGPIILGGRKKPEDYKEITDKMGIDLDDYMDAIREIKVFSFKGVNSVVSLLHDSINYLVKLGFQKNKLETWLPGFLKLSENNRIAYAHLYLNKLLNSLLDITIAVTKGESGSVMMYNEKSNELIVKLSRGINLDLVNQTRIKNGERISGFVAAERKGYLFNDKIKNKGLKTLMKRPEIKSSMVIPINIGENLYGVFTVNAYNDNNSFNKRNLGLLNQLGDLAAIAITTFNIKDVAHTDTKTSLLW